MSLSLNKPKLDNLAGDIWKSAERLRGKFKAYECYLGEKVGEVKRIAATIEAEMAALTAYRKSLMHECVTGQRRVTEADLRRPGRTGSIPSWG